MENNSQIKNLKILVVGHVTESYGPMQALPHYLAKRVREFAVISHPFPYCEIYDSKAHLFKDGKVIRKYSGPKYKSFYLIHYISDILLTFYFVLKLKRRWHLYIGSDCLNAFTGIILRGLGVVSRVVFYEHDYTPKRFDNNLMNRFFHFINSFAVRHADAVWDNPPNLSEIRKRQRANPSRVIRVPHGVDLDKVNIPPQEKIERRTLVYAGYVDQAKGLQLVVKAVQKVVKRISDIRVSIVGSGHFEPELKRLVREANLEGVFEFFGFTDHDWTLSYLPQCGIALAPYVDEIKGTFRFCDPLKVKDYLACGLPVIVTRVPAIAKEVEVNTLGIAINYDQKDLEEAIIKLVTDDEFYQKCRENILPYARKISWKHTYDQAFEKTFKIVGV